jgi:RNA polymerase subunit RPABC4/transcription elongation factor Spt4
MWLRVCSHCGQQTPGDQKVCASCGRAQSNDMWWKVPLIILLFLIAFGLAFSIKR